MLQQQIVLLVQKSIKEQVDINDYSTIFYQTKIADNYTQGGIFSAINQEPLPDYVMNYLDAVAFFKIYNDALMTDERFNIIEIRFSKDMTPDAKFSWDQAYYDADVEGNKKLKKKK